MSDKTVSENVVEGSPLFKVAADVRIDATPLQVYSVVSDLGRSGEWSEECVGGEWVEGEPATVGAVFRGDNHRDEDVVAWAPVVRGAWSTRSEVVAAEAGATFAWAIQDSSGRRQESVWTFDIEAEGTGSRLIHHFRMGAPTEGIRGITAEMDAERKQAFFADWGAKLEKDLAATVERIKDVIEGEFKS
ncbi:SRPBCC family protein [Streptomyces sp. NPDC001530]|uniref:SRPBCC family protein n=1 Tax=Streptomyces sp. NPDC001530 TaxID=3364582 RepID=UPI003698DC57